VAVNTCPISRSHFAGRKFFQAMPLTLMRSWLLSMTWRPAQNSFSRMRFCVGVASIVRSSERGAPLLLEDRAAEKPLSPRLGSVNLPA
jgi:hypothetical protein